MILSNQAYCLKCNDGPYSAHVHDFQYCKCGAMAVDGGMEYLRRLGSHYRDVSIVISDEDGKALLEAIADPSKNDLGKLCNVSRVLRDRMGINIGEYNESV